MRVTDSRIGPLDPSVRRRRECEKCKDRVTTYETKVNSAAGVIEYAEALARKLETMLIAATQVQADLDNLREICRAHRIIESAPYDKRWAGRGNDGASI